MRAVILLLLILLVGQLFGSNRDYTQWWLFEYGDYERTIGTDDYRVEWAREVFERVKNASEKNDERPPRLFFIKSGAGPYAMALPDGGIIVHPGTLDICYDGCERTEGDRRIAFILGHELAHLANKDYIHREVYLALESHGDNKVRKELLKYFEVPRSEKEKTFKTREFIADQKGVLFADMAGYDVSRLFRKNDNFLKYWANQVGIKYAYDEKKHPSMEKRVKNIRVQLSKVIAHIELFRAGVLLYQIGSYHDSASVFREFSKVYPSREVFNNIGTCYLCLALKHLALKYADDYYRFKISSVVDIDTPAEKLHLRGELDYLRDKEIIRYLKNAEKNFQAAVSRDKQDLTSRYNLAAALIFKKDFAGAQKVCNELLKKDPKDVNALNNKAVAFYYYGKEENLETVERAVQLLKDAHRLAPGNSEVLYNLASIKQERKRMAGARNAWEKYLKLPKVWGDGYCIHVYEKLRGKSPAQHRKNQERAGAGESRVPEMPGGIELRQEFLEIKKQWGENNIWEYNLGYEGSGEQRELFLSLQVAVKGRIRVVALEGTVELVEEVRPAESILEILKKYGPPKNIVRHTHGNFYVYPERGFSIKERDGEVHSYTWFETGF
jgi:tetratricopeptide (TPR) repeat protein